MAATSLNVTPAQRSGLAGCLFRLDPSHPRKTHTCVLCVRCCSDGGDPIWGANSSGLVRRDGSHLQTHVSCLNRNGSIPSEMAGLMVLSDGTSVPSLHKRDNWFRQIEGDRSHPLCLGPSQSTSRSAEAISQLVLQTPTPQVTTTRIKVPATPPTTARAVATPALAISAQVMYGCY